MTKEQNRTYYLAHREEVIERTKEYQHANLGKCAACKRAYYHANHDRVLERIKTYRREHPEVSVRAVRKWQVNNKDKSKVAAQARFQIPLASTCEVCGKPATARHHDDYSRPLDVKSLCAQCHCDVHRGVNL
jgi:hypothetical protein